MDAEEWSANVLYRIAYGEAKTVDGNPSVRPRIGSRFRRSDATGRAGPGD